ncbi:MAG: hypothetical protein AB7O66_16485 [Limisphaerales bacterium]
MNTRESIHSIRAALNAAVIGQETVEFAVFSQREGAIEIPAFEARFASRDGFTGPGIDRRAQVPAVSVTIRRPPGISTGAFVVSTPSFDAEETWEPVPSPAEPGAVFKRVITQRAADIPGMALAAAPIPDLDGLRVYTGSPGINDQLQRGEFRGERIETLTYLARKPGAHTIPAIRYAWWNPGTERLEVKTLPEVTLEITSPAPAEAQPATRGFPTRHGAWTLALGVIAGAGLLGAWQRRRLRGWVAWIGARWNPPDHVAARRLLRACRRSDAEGALSAWTRWTLARAPDSPPLPDDLRRAVVELERSLYGAARPGQGPGRWHGQPLAGSFRAHLRRRHRARHGGASALPALNPRPSHPS